MQHLAVTLLLFGFTSAAFAAPWGSAKLMDIEYKPQKVLYDIDHSTSDDLSNILDRISLLNKHYGADPFDSHITLVIHGDAIPFFATKNYKQHQQLMKRVQQFSLADNIEFKLCAAAARARYELEPKDFHGFIKMVPMADAEIIRLQKEEGFAYMR